MSAQNESQRLFSCVCTLWLLAVFALPLEVRAQDDASVELDLEEEELAQPLAQRPVRDAIEFQLEGNCVSRQNVFRGLSYWLQASEMDGALSFRVRSWKSPAEGQFRAAFTLSRSGEVIVTRELEGASSCHELTQALVLTMAIAVDGSVLDRTALGRPELLPGPDEDSSTKAEESLAEDRGGDVDDSSEEEGIASRRDNDEVARLSSQWDVGIAGAAFLLPEVTAVVSVRGGVVFRGGASVHFGFSHALRQEFAAEPARARASLFSGSLWGCLGPGRDDGWRGRGCLGALAGAVPLAGRGSEEDQTSLGVLAGPGAEVSLGHLSRNFLLETHLTGVAHVLRPRLVVETPEGPTRTSFPVASAQLGLRAGVLF